MDQARYLESQRLQSAFAMMIATSVGADLPEFTAAARRALDVGVFMDPTAWMKGRNRLEKIAALSEAMHNVVLKFTELLRVFAEEGDKEAAELVIRIEEAARVEGG
jgi:hypothetical protein